MKLQNKINYRFLALLLVVFLLAGVVLYFVLGLVVSENLDEILEHRAESVKMHVQANPAIAQIAESPDQSISIRPTTKPVPTRYSDTSIFDKHEREYVTYRKVSFGFHDQNQQYIASIVLSKLETEDLAELIFYFLLGLFALIVLVLFVLNRWLSSSVWKPFYRTLDHLSLFQIEHKNDVNFSKSDVYEFDQLNKALKIMINKAQADFRNLKEFTENASHEIQTPLAIIQSKLESVLQDKALAAERYEQIRVAYESVSRLSKLNEALLLLSKIENRQFPEIKAINLYDLVSKRLQIIEELIHFKNIDLKCNCTEAFVVEINPYLAEILINNLLGNSIKHNFEGGNIYIVSDSKSLTISNSGSTIDIHTEKLFQRFTKYNTGNESTGLGLAIASEICQKSGLKLDYRIENEIHHLEVSHE